MSTMEDGKLVEFGGGSRVKREWEDIQLELLMKILSFLDDRTVIVASGVCRRWRDVICTELTHLSLSWCTNNMNNLVLSLAPKFANLRVLSLQQKEEPLLEFEAVKTVATNCHDLEDLDLSMSSNLCDWSLYYLARGCPKLVNLNIRGCSAFSEHGLQFLTSYCSKLKILNLCGCYDAVTNKILKLIGDNFRQLESINLCRCYGVGDAGVLSLAYGCSNLNAINLCHCFYVTDESVIALANNCLHLRSLGLDDCRMITDQAMYALAQSRVKNKDEGSWALVKSRNEEEGLMNLDINRCKALTPTAVQAVCDSFPALHTCPARKSLIMYGCSKLTSVHCACAVCFSIAWSHSPLLSLMDGQLISILVYVKVFGCYWTYLGDCWFSQGFTGSIVIIFVEIVKMTNQFTIKTAQNRVASIAYAVECRVLIYFGLSPLK